MLHPTIDGRITATGIRNHPVILRHCLTDPFRTGSGTVPDASVAAAEVALLPRGVTVSGLLARVRKQWVNLVVTRSRSSQVAHSVDEHVGDLLCLRP